MIRTALTEEFGIEVPVFAFTPSKAVAAAVSRAGGLGVLGCVRYNDADELDRALDYMDAETDGRPYGVDVVMPNKVPTEGSGADLGAMIPEEHRAFVSRVLDDLGVPPLAGDASDAGVLGWLHSVAQSHVDVALAHRPVLIANALGSPPADVIARAHDAGVRVAALAGAARHALAHADADRAPASTVGEDGHGRGEHRRVVLFQLQFVAARAPQERAHVTAADLLADAACPRRRRARQPALG